MYFVFGINHKNANIEIRERYHKTSGSIDILYEKLDFLKEITIISTCNRFEIYGYTDELSSSKLKDLMFKCLNILPSDRKYFYILFHNEAVSHLFKVVSGLDSKIVGENQIYDQVKKSYYYSLKLGKTKYFLNKLFQRSLSVAGKVRNKFSICFGKISIGSIIKSEITKYIDRPKILILGTGEIVNHILPYIKSISNEITVVSTRHLDRAIDLSKKFGIQYERFERLRDILNEYDVIITATNCPFTIIDSTFFENNKNEKIIFDLAVPRNVDPDIHKNNIKLYNIDEICETSKNNLESRKNNFDYADKFIYYESIKFMESIKCDLMKREIIIGSRRSKLAIKQVEEFLEKLLERVPSLKVKFIEKYFDTTGDIDKKTPIYKIEGTDFFTDVIEEKLINKEIDIAVHSAKDLPDIHKDNIITIALTESMDRTDCLVLRRDLSGYTIFTLPPNTVIGVSSKRRIEQIKKIRPDIITKDIRGNIDERLAKLDSGEYDGVIMATIALKRLGLEHKISQILPIDIFDTHPLQGSLAIQIRTEDIKKFSFLLKLDTRTRIVFNTNDKELETKLVNYVNKYYWQKLIAFRKEFIRNPDKIIDIPNDFVFDKDKIEKLTLNSVL